MKFALVWKRIDIQARLLKDALDILGYAGISLGCGAVFASQYIEDETMKWKALAVSTLIISVGIFLMLLRAWARISWLEKVKVFDIRFVKGKTDDEQ